MRTYFLTVWAAALLGALACSQGSGAGNMNDNAANENISGASSQVEFPETIGADSSIVNINQGDGISAKILGAENEPGVTADVVGLSGDIGSDDFSADFDDALRTERATIAATEVDIEYAEDDTFSFTVNRGAETLFSGTDLAVPRTNARRIQQVTLDEIDGCTVALIQGFAFTVVQDMTSDPSAFPDQATLDCLTGVEELEEISTLTCISTLVLIPSLIQALAECQLFNDPLTCLDRAAPAAEALSFFTEILFVVQEEVVRQVLVDGELCAPI